MTTKDMIRKLADGTGFINPEDLSEGELIRFQSVVAAALEAKNLGYLDDVFTHTNVGTCFYDLLFVPNVTEAGILYAGSP